MDGKSAESLRIPMISGRYGRRLLGFLHQQRIDATRVLEGSGLDENTLNQPDLFLTMEQVCHILGRCKRELDDELAPFRFGQGLDLHGHGLRGFAQNSRNNPRCLAEMILHYFRVTLPIMGLQLHCDGRVAMIRLEDTWDLGELRDFVCKIYLGSVHSLTRPFSLACSIEFDFPSTLPPCQWHRTAGGTPVRFGGEYNQVVVPLDALRSTIGGGAPTPPVDAGTAPDTAEVVRRARRLITEQPGRDATLDRVAHRLGMSSRSLRRHLSLAGYTFSDIRNEVRLGFATRYLTESRVSLDTIAEWLGYSDQASFSKAYRTWTGKTPGQVRRSHQRPDD